MICIMALNPSLTFAHDAHVHHAKHNMIMLGEKEVFLSHIVYKVPHNYQVVLKITLDDASFQEYLNAKHAAPDDLFILLLDPMDISKISEASSISGSILAEDKQGIRKEILPNVQIEKKNFQIVYFDELPLNLEQ